MYMSNPGDFRLIHTLSGTIFNAGQATEIRDSPARSGTSGHFTFMGRMRTFSQQHAWLQYLGTISTISVQDS